MDMDWSPWQFDEIVCEIDIEEKLMGIFEKEKIAKKKSSLSYVLDDIFKTHSELTTLNDEFNELYKHYNTNENSDELVNEEEFFIESQTSSDNIIEQVEGILEASVRQPTTDRGEIKQLVTSNYKFQGVPICQKSWFIIYAIEKTKREAIRTHYSKNDISPIVHGLKGRVSNHAIKFETILHILTFIQNFAMQHGLHSPGNI
ncbi:2908_t:CDS:2 [Gigaspora rosea]|nr:2908_t:CDS:2 [Gigaspora rosea]